MKVYFLLPFLMLFMSACQDKSIVKIYEENLAKEKVSCLKLVISPPDIQTQRILEDMYDFTDTCKNSLSVFEKSGIVCNSTHNAAQKTMSSFPSGYLRLEVKRGDVPLYSYYIDLVGVVDKNALEVALSRLKEDLELK